MVTSIGVALQLILVVPTIGKNGFWVDEAYTLGATSQLFDALTRTGGNMILYYALLTPLTWISTDPGWLRLPSLACTLAAVGFVTGMARRIGGIGVALAAVVLFAMLRIVEIAAMTIRGYGLLILMTAASWYAVVRLIETDTDGPPNRRWINLACALAIIGPLVHGTFLLCSLSILVAIALHRLTRQYLKRFAVALAVAFAIEVVLWFFGADDLGPRVFIAREVVVSMGTVVGSAYVSVALVFAFLALTGITYLYRWATATRPQLQRQRGGPTARLRTIEVPTRIWLGLLPLLGVLIPYVSLACIAALRHHFFPTRYLSIITPSLAVGAALGLGIIAGRLNEERPTRLARTRLAVAGVLAIAVIAGQIRSQPDITSRYDTGWKASVAYLDQHVRPGDKMIIEYPGHRYLRVPFEANWEAVDHDYSPQLLNYERSQLGQTKRFDAVVPPSDVSRRFDGVERIWVVRTLNPEPGYLDKIGLTERFHRVDSQRFDGRTRVVLIDLYEPNTRAGT